MNKQILLILFIAAFAVKTSAQQITSITPNTGKRGDVLNLQITGSQVDFTQASNLTVTIFNSATNIKANSVSVISSTQIVARVGIPLNANYQACNVVVGNVPNVSYLQKEAGFTVVNQQGAYPQITSVTPTSGIIGETLDLNITGSATKFMQATQIQGWFYSQGSSTMVVNNVNATSDTTLVANITIPPTTKVGQKRIVLHTSNEGIIFSKPEVEFLAYLGGNVPQLINVTPNGTSPDQPFELTITGLNTNFQASNTYQVKLFNSATQLEANNVQVLSATSIKATVTPSNNLGGGGTFDLKLTERPSLLEWWYYGAISIGVATGKNEVVKTTKSANVLIYPIPTLDEINIDNIGNLKQIEMFTQTGKLTTINFSDIEKHNVGYKFSTKKYGFSPGIYFIKIVHDDKITYRKVLIN